MNKGLFITIEGPDGSGKSTQIKRLKDYFNSKGYMAVFTREPGGTAISEKIRELILDKESKEMAGMAEALLYSASRAQLVAEVIGPAIDRGETVICDRFLDSSIAYQGYGRELGDCIRTINEYAVQGYIPDLTLLMKINPKLGKERIPQKDLDRIEAEKQAFHRRVYEGYLNMEKEYDRFVGIDASRSVEDISAVIIERVEALMRIRGVI
ncbi:MAG: dTMP kinase [Eubacteriales bacterium]|nr:dTMP kinase [Eubacteriales bacterium]MDD4390667.1 dTMP kinase [Eubacteriales bacterium]